MARHIELLRASDWRKICSDCSMQPVCLPASLEGRSIALLEQVIETMAPLRRGDHLFHQGDRFDSFYAVRWGYLKTYREDDGGEEQVLGFQMAGELLGMDGVSAGSMRGSAEALDTAVVCRLPFDALIEACQQAPELQRAVLAMMSRDILLSHFLAASSSVDARLGAFLLRWGQRLGQRGFSRRRFVLPMRRQDIGNYLRIAPETVCRTLKRFSDNGWLEVRNRTVYIVDETALAAPCPEEWGMRSGQLGLNAWRQSG